MQIYECILTLISGIGVFILAMKLLSDSLNVLAGEKMKALLQKIAGNRISGVLVGALVTAAIHSSAATTIMAIGFVKASAIIIGANIGTTTTGLLASLESLNMSLYLSLFCFIGVMLAFIKKIKKIANLLIGLGMIFVGLKIMSSACNDESIKSGFRSVFEVIDFPLLLELLGLLFTAILQSSTAMTGLVIVMISNQAMNMQNALFITLGANVGTCITALIGIIGTNKNSKRVAVIHLTFNILGCSLFTPFLWIFTDDIISLLRSMVSKEGIQIAIFHLFFNCVTALITTPLIKYLVKFSEFVIKDKGDEDNIKEKLVNNEDYVSDILRDGTVASSDAYSEDIKIEKNNRDINENNKNFYGNGNEKGENGGNLNGEENKIEIPAISNNNI